MRDTKLVVAVAAAILVGAVATACSDLGGLSGAADPGGGDSAPGSRSDGSDDLDAACGGLPPPPSSRCDTQKPFGSPELVTAFDPTADYVKGAILSRDELEVFYLRYGAAASKWDLRHARRPARDAAWGTVVTEPVTPSPDGMLSLTAADLKLYFWTISSDYRTSRTSTSNVFAMPAQFDVASAPAAFFVAADDTAYFAVYEGDGGSDKVIKRASVTSSGFSFTSTTVPNIHLPMTFDSRPVLNTSETALYFSSNRPGGLGLDDIWVSRRPSKQTEFGPPAHLAALSTDKPDVVSWVSDDECQVFLERASHVYLATRPR